jgi:ATP-dependent helicase/DNAse subunit B
MNKKESILSASRIKTLESCSWLYWCKYYLKLPEKGNSGALRGTVCHLILELLLKKRHKKHFNSITKEGHIKASKPVDKIVRKFLKKHELLTSNEGEQLLLEEDHYELCSDMILVALKNDFFCKGGKLLEPEYEFLIENEDPPYKVMGYMDKTATYDKDKKIVISDYKTSKRKFAGEDLDSNLQGLIYSLAATKIWPKLKPVINFLFLKFPRKPVQELNFKESQLNGLEYYLSHVFKIINNFNSDVAETNFASDQPMPPKNGGFKGPLNCGFAKRKGQLKKNGALMWHCPFKFDFEYYILTDKDNNIVSSALSEEELPKPKKEQSIHKKHYDGCPAHKQGKDPFDF